MEENAASLSNSPHKKDTSSLKVFIIIFFGLLSVTSIFFAGFFTSKLIVSPLPDIKFTQNTPTPAPFGETPTPFFQITDVFEKPTNFYTTGKTYFNDTVVAVTIQEPRKALIITTLRQENAVGLYNHSTRLSYFDGEKWIRNISNEGISSTSEILISDLVPQWDLKIHENRLLKEQLTMRINTTDQLEIQTETLENEITLRSFPWDTKFMSQARGLLSINGTTPEPIAVASIRRYSLNTDGLQFYDPSLSSITDWVLFWTESGNFYHVDKTYVNNPNPIYKSHALAVQVDTQKNVSRTFELTSTRDNDNTPTKYVFSLHTPIENTLTLDTSNVFNRATGSTIDLIGFVEGTITEGEVEEKGVGFFQYLRD